MKNTLSGLKTYKTKSIFAKNFILLFSSIVIPIIITSVIFSYIYFNSIEKRYDQENNNRFHTMTSVSDKVFEQVNSNMALIYSNSYVNRFFSFKFDNYKDIQLYSFEIQALENVFTINESNFYSIIMYSEKNNMVYNQTITDYDYFQQNNMEFAEYLKTVKSICVKKTKINSIDCVSVFVPLWSYSTDRGTIAYNLSAKNLEYYFGSTINVDNLINMDFKFGDKTVFRYKISDITNPSTVYETDSKYYDLHYRFAISDTDRLNNIRLIKIAIFVFILITLISVLILSFLLSAKAYMPISTLMEITQSPESWANNHIVSGQSPQNELEYIIAKISNSIDFSGDGAARVALLKRSHTVALQAQINPHFLYNTLAVINMVILETVGDDCAASDMLVSLSDYLRYTFKINNIIVPLSTELQFAEKYVEIMKYRYGDKISFKMNHDKELDNINVIKLSIQPIIENAIYHGIVPSENKTETITVSTFRKKQFAVMCIENTGKIISDEDIKKIENMINDSSNSMDEHIGIINVDKRIKYTFGNNYGIRVSTDGNTTRFELLFPYS